MIDIEYDCGCIYTHWGVDGVKMAHACTDHKIMLYTDAIKERLVNET